MQESQESVIFLSGAITDCATSHKRTTNGRLWHKSPSKPCHPHHISLRDVGCGMWCGKFWSYSGKATVSEKCIISNWARRRFGNFLNSQILAATRTKCTTTYARRVLARNRRQLQIRFRIQPTANAFERLSQYPFGRGVAYAVLIRIA